MFHTKVVEKIKTRVSFYSFGNRAVYEIVLKNVVASTSREATDRLHPPTHTYSEYLILITSDGNNAYAIAGHCCVYMYIACLVYSHYI